MHVQIYTRSTCSFCERARRALERSGIPFREQSLDQDRRLAQRLLALFGRPAMPYVLIDGEPLGGVDELEEWLAGEG